MNVASHTKKGFNQQQNLRIKNLLPNESVTASNLSIQERLLIIYIFSVLLRVPLNSKCHLTTQFSFTEFLRSNFVFYLKLSSIFFILKMAGSFPAIFLSIN